MSTRRPSVRRRIAAVVSAPLLLVSFAACGTDDGKGEATDEPTALQSGDPVTPAQFAALTKSSVEKATTAHMTMDMAMGRSGGIHAEGDVSYEGNTPSMQMTMTMPGVDGQLDMVLVDSTMYMKMPGVSGGKYFEIDLSDTGNLPPELADMVDQMDPLKSVEEFRDAVDEVTYEGTDEVGGESLDHYLVKVDTTQVDQLQQLEGQGVDMPDSLDYDFWLDSDGMMSKMETDFTIMGQHMSMEVGLDQWGEDVSIEAPPAGQTRPMPGLTTAG